MTILDFGLSIVGLPEETIKELDDHLPHLGRLSDALKQAEPLIGQLLPILNKAYPDIVAVTPLLQKLIVFAKQKESER